MDVKELFSKAENGTLTYEQFSELATKSNAKFADLSSGNYVSKQKYDDDIANRDTTITELRGNITTRDNDLKTLQEQIKNAGENDTKISDLTAQLTNLQEQYGKEKEALQKKLNEQAYEFAAKSYASKQNFTSKAAERDFTNCLINKRLTLENGQIVGADDFKKTYETENADAFVSEDKKKVPQFVQKTDGKIEPPEKPIFNFAGVRKRPKGD